MGLGRNEPPFRIWMLLVGDSRAKAGLERFPFKIVCHSFIRDGNAISNSKRVVVSCDNHDDVDNDKDDDNETTNNDKFSPRVRLGN